MADISWPESLPYPNSGWSMTPSDNILRSQPERGPAKTRRRSSAKAVSLSGSLLVTSSQLDTFISFAEETLLDCALPFSFPDYLRDKDGMARISSYSVTQEGADEYIISIELEVLP